MLSLQTLALLAASCGSARAQDLPSLEQLLTTDMSVLSGLINASNLDYTNLAETTVFAPSNDAFNLNLAPEVRDKITGNIPLLTNVLRAHVAANKRNSTQLIALGTVPTLLTTPAFSVTVEEQEGRVTVDQSVVTKANIDTTNATVHEIDYVLIPPLPELRTTVVEVAAGATSNLRTLSSLLIAANLTANLSNPETRLTLFAPTDAAFTECISAELRTELLKPENIATLQRVLAFHVVLVNPIPANVSTQTLEGSNVTVDTSTVLVNGRVVANITSRWETGGSAAAQGLVLDFCLLPPDVDLNALLSSEGLSTTSVILIVLGALALLIIAAVVVAMVLRSKRRKADGYQSAEDGYDMKA